MINGMAYIVMSFAGVLVPQYRAQMFLYSQPALFGELALMLWLVIKGARPAADGAFKSELRIQN